MLRYTALVALAFVPFAAASAAPAQVVAEKDGLKFEYRTQVADGKVVLDGRLLNEPEKFKFTVERDGYVHGNVGDQDVNFTISRKDHDALIAEVAKEDGLALADLRTGN